MRYFAKSFVLSALSAALLFPLAQAHAVPGQPSAANMEASDTLAPVAAAYEAVLAARITPDGNQVNRFDYAGAKAEDADNIAAYIRHLEGQKPASMTASEATAYWANLYNAVTLKLIMDNYPVKSIRKIGRPWKRKLVTVEGKVLTLDDIEHKILRKQFPSPYIHYMVNCASIGCPNLQPELWQATTLEDMQKAAAREFINSPRGVSITARGLKVSSIYKWFDEDFGGNKASLLAHIAKYAEGELAAAIDGGAKITGYGYDWTLNE